MRREKPSNSCTLQLLAIKKLQNLYKNSQKNPRFSMCFFLVISVSSQIQALCKRYIWLLFRCVSNTTQKHKMYFAVVISNFLPCGNLTTAQIDLSTLYFVLF